MTLTLVIEEVGPALSALMRCRIKLWVTDRFRSFIMYKQPLKMSSKQFFVLGFEKPKFISKLAVGNEQGGRGVGERGVHCCRLHMTSHLHNDL